MKDEFYKIEKSGRTRLANMERPILLGDYYKKVRFLGMEYGGLFRGIKKCDYEGNQG